MTTTTPADATIAAGEPTPAFIDAMAGNFAKEAPVVEVDAVVSVAPAVSPDDFDLNTVLATPVHEELPAAPSAQVDELDLNAVLSPNTTSADAPGLSAESEVDELARPANFPTNVTHQYSTQLPKETGSPDTLDLPPATRKHIEERLGQVPNVDITLSSQQQRWAETLRQGMNYMPMEGMYTQRLEKAGSKFTQSIVVNGRELRGRAPTFNAVPGTNEVDGERALLQLVTHLGVGGLFHAPLWSTGLWVMFKPATETEQLELNRILFADKVSLGRWSYGLALSNHVVYTLERVFEFALRHVYSTSVKAEELPISKLRDYILPQDVNSFIWGFLCANYPSGFHYTTGCIENPNKCNNVMEATLNVTKLQNTDESELTEWQKQHMCSTAANSKSLDSLKRYREESKATQPRRLVLNENTNHELAITIKTPTVTDYINQGHRWISGIVDSINQAIGMDATAEERNVAINQMGKATTLCQYSHWIESIEFGEVSIRNDTSDERAISSIKDMATVEDSLKTLSSTDSIREKIIAEVLSYISDSTISIIGVPAYDCPVCKTPQEGVSSYPQEKSLIPLDVLQVFFGLLSQRLDRIETR